MEAVIEHADACRERIFMAGFHEGTIKNGGLPFHLGTTECAIAEKALRTVERGESLLIHNPFPTTSLPVALIASYAYSQKPAIPGSDELPMLVFPASSRGYLGEIDKFHFQTTLSADDNKTPLIPRHPIDSFSETNAYEWGVYTANSGFLFDNEIHDVPLGALFIDLQKPEWSEREFDNIEQFCEEHPDVPAIFYTDKMGPAAELTCERLDSDPVRVTNGMLAQAPHDDPVPGESDLTTQEHILSNGGVEMLQFPVMDEDFGSLIPELIELKNKCQNRDLAYVEVSRVFNRLTKQPFKPRYWSRTVGANAFYEDVPGYIDRIERRADNIDSGSDLLYTYARKANEVQGHLNNKHVLQNTVLDALQRAGDDENDSRFVVKNSSEREALRLAATDSGYAIPENVEIIDRGNVTPMPDTRYVFLYPPYGDDYVYEFPPSKQVAYIHNALWSNYVRSSAKMATEDITVTYKTTSIGRSGTVGEVDDHVFDIDTLESDIEGHLRTADFGGSHSRSESSGGSATTASADEDEVRFHFQNRDPLSFSPRSIVTVYDPELARINRKRAANVSEDEQILLLDSVVGDIYDVLLESAHKREAVRDNEQSVENWRNVLERGMEREDMEYSDVVDALQERGSDITHWHSVRAWAKGRYMGPLDEGDCRRIFHIFRPELEGVLLEQFHEQVWKAMKHLRLLHRRMGRNVRRAVEAEFNPATSAEFGEGVNERMVRNIARDIERETVKRIDRPDDT